MTLRVGTRRSDLALVQAEQVARQLAGLGERPELVPLSTEGDRQAERPFEAFDARGVFVAELERALAAGRVDLAVHSLKDVPAAETGGLVLAAILPRADPSDALLVRPDSWRPDAPALPLERGARVGTSSSRRRAQLLALRDDLEIVPLRGNVPTRLGRLSEGRCDAIVLAAAGLERLAGDEARGAAARSLLAPLRRFSLDVTRCVPAPGQGAIAVQARASDDALVRRVARLDGARARVETGVERALLAAAESGCSAPFGALCRADDTGLTVHGFLERGGEVRRASVHGADARDAVGAACTRLGIRGPGR